MSEELTFPKFSKLPVELQLAIWELSLPESRVVTVCEYLDTRRRKRRPKEWMLFRQGGGGPRNSIYYNHLVPPLLQVSRDSRRVALKAFSASVALRSVASLWSDQLGSMALLNPMCDVLHIKHVHLSRELGLEWTQDGNIGDTIRGVTTISVSIWELYEVSQRDRSDYFQQFLTDFRGLDTILLTIMDPKTWQKQENLTNGADIVRLDAVEGGDMLHQLLGRSQARKILRLVQKFFQQCERDRPEHKFPRIEMAY